MGGIGPPGPRLLLGGGPRIPAPYDGIGPIPGPLGGFILGLIPIPGGPPKIIKRKRKKYKQSQCYKILLTYMVNKYACMYNVNKTNTQNVPKCKIFFISQIDTYFI